MAQKSIDQITKLQKFMETLELNQLEKEKGNISNQKNQVMAGNLRSSVLTVREVEKKRKLMDLLVKLG